jgi:hypothetical protein
MQIYLKNGNCLCILFIQDLQEIELISLYCNHSFNNYNFINRKMHYNWHFFVLLFCFAAATLPTRICGGTGAAGGELTQRYPKNASTSTAITEEDSQNDDQGEDLQE